MKKRILSILLSVLMVLTLVPNTVIFSSAVFIDSGKCGENVNYTIDDMGTLTISGTENMTDYDGWFDRPPWYIYCEILKTVVVETGVTGIGTYAFEDCTSLTSITIPDSITCIGDYAFSGCTSLTSITIPEGVTNIGQSAFSGCTALTDITIPGSVTNIDWHAFSGCTSLTEIILPGSLTEIGYRLFSSCTSLKSITIPESITNIVNSAFYNCTAFTSITVDENNKYYSSSDGVLFNKDKTELILYPQGRTNTEYTIPTGVTSVGWSAFEDCTSLKSISLPTDLTYIGSNAFEGCTSLTNISLPAGVTDIGDSTFSGCTSLTNISLPADLTGIGDSAFSGCTSLTNISLPAGLTDIGNSAFSGCTSLINISLPAGVTDIGCKAFGETPFYKNLPDGVVYLGKVLYEYKGNMPEITNIEINNGTVSISSNAFEDCTSLKSITIPDSVKQIGMYAFQGCTSLSDIYYSGSEEQWNNILNQSQINSKIHYNYAIILNGKCGDNITYRLANNGTLIISGTGLMTDYASVTDVPWYKHRESINSIVIENAIKGIGNYAFAGCSAIKDFTIPHTVTEIGEYAFYGCTSLKDVYYIGNKENWYCIVKGTDNEPLIQAKIHYVLIKGLCGKDINYMLEENGTLTISGTGSMDNYNYNNFDKKSPWNSKNALIKTVVIENGVTSIGISAFSGCSSLKNISIPESVTAIGYGAFFECTSLTDITIPEGITDISYETFSGCTSLKNISIPKGVIIIDISAFKDCTSLENITIPEGVTSIGSSAFQSCTSLKNITIPEGVTSIGNCAFSDCISLTGITIPEGVTSIGNGAFAGCSSLKNISIPDSATSIGYGAFSECISLTGITIPEGVTDISDTAFAGCISLTGITIPKGVTSIGYGAFSKCISLTGITIPEGVTDIGDGAFSGCTSLKNITIPKGVTDIGYGAFSECISLTGITIPEGVTDIGDGAFAGCISLTGITIPEGVTDIGYGAFSECISLTGITIPEGVTDIGRYAFAGCTSLKNITIPKSLTDIGIYAFAGCASLKNITIPAFVKSIGMGAFEYCITLADITVDSENTYFSDSDGVLFDKDKTILIVYPISKKDTEYTIPDSVTNIFPGAFSLCPLLKSIKIPAGVTVIDDMSFFGTTAITDITVDENNKNYSSSEGVLFNKDKTKLIKYPECKTNTDYDIPAGVNTISDSALYNCSSLKNITIPDSLTSIGENAFSGCTSLTKITVSENNKNYFSSDDVLLNKNKTELIKYPALKTTAEYKIPDSVTTVADYAFNDCAYVTDITIPDSVTEIGYSAFNGCKSLANINVDKNNKDYLSIGGVLFDKEKTMLIKYPAAKADKEYAVPDGITGIDSAFDDCAYLTDITIPDSVTRIGYSAFNGCKSLANINVDKNNNNYLSIGGVLFDKEKTMLIKYPAAKTDKEYAVPDGIISIDYAFEDCVYLTDITIPDSVKYLGLPVFYECNSLENITISENNIAFSSSGGVLFNKDKTTLIRYPANKINTEYTIPDGVKNIDLAAFYGCTAIKNIKIPDSVTSIYPGAFDGCTSLSDVYYKGNRVQWESIDIGNYANKPLLDALVHFNYVEHQHTPGDWIVDKEPTCTEPGSRHQECTVCGETIKTENIPAAGHKLMKIEAELPTCTAEGSNAYYKCSECKLYFKDSEGKISTTPDAEKLEKLPHTETVVEENRKEPTCTADGKYDKVTKCSVCGTVISRETIVINAAGHKAGKTVEKNRKESTCTAAGHYDKVTYCKECNKELSRETVELPLAEHTAEIIPAVPATCTKTGLTEGKKCSVCGEILTAQNVIKAKGHAAGSWIVDKEPTCKEEGLKHLICSVCGETIKTEAIAKSDNHSFGEWVITKEATYSEKGSKERKCSVCGKTETAVIPVLKAEKEIKAENTGVSLKFDNAVLDKNVKLNVIEKYDGGAFDVINTEKGSFSNKIFDITLTDSKGKVQPDGFVLVGIPLPEGYKAENTVVYYVSEKDNSLTKINSYVKDGIIWFETDHFSAYAVVDETKRLDGDMDGDGKLTAGDARTVLRASVGLEELSSAQKAAADADKDKAITAADARIVLRRSVGLPD